MRVNLDTPRLILREFTADDVDNLAALDGDPPIMRDIRGGRPPPRDEIRGDMLPRSSPTRPYAHLARGGGYTYLH